MTIGHVSKYLFFPVLSMKPHNRGFRAGVRTASRHTLRATPHPTPGRESPASTSRTPGRKAFPAPAFRIL